MRLGTTRPAGTRPLVFSACKHTAGIAGGNTATGSRALSENTTGSANTANGAYALERKIFGSDNTAMGFEALRFNTMGIGNTAVGSLALQQTPAATISPSALVYSKEILTPTKI